MWVFSCFYNYLLTSYTRFACFIHHILLQIVGGLRNCIACTNHIHVPLMCFYLFSLFLSNGRLKSKQLIDSRIHQDIFPIFQYRNMFLFFILIDLINEHQVPEDLSMIQNSPYRSNVLFSSNERI